MSGIDFFVPKQRDRRPVLVISAAQRRPSVRGRSLKYAGVQLGRHAVGHSPAESPDGNWNSGGIPRIAARRAGVSLCSS
jgi:hypothetical protein